MLSCIQYIYSSFTCLLYIWICRFDNSSWVWVRLSPVLLLLIFSQEICNLKNVSNQKHIFYKTSCASVVPYHIMAYFAVWCHCPLHLLLVLTIVKWRTVWVKKIPPPKVIWFVSFFHKRLRIFNRFFRHLLHVPMYARLQIFIQLSPTLTKLCHIKRDYLVRILCAKCR